MLRPRVRGIGAIVVVALAAAACTAPPTTTAPSSSPGSTSPGSPGSMPPPWPPSLPSSTSSPFQVTRETDVIVQIACEKEPEQVKRLLPAAKAFYKTDDPLGAKCTWGSAPDAAVRIELLAVRPQNYTQRVALLPGPRPEVDLPGAKGATTNELQICVVVLDVDARALEIQAFGFKEPGCTQAIAVARDVVAARAPSSRTRQPTPASSAPVSAQR